LSQQRTLWIQAKRRGYRQRAGRIRHGDWVADGLEFNVPAPDLFERIWPRMRDRGYGL
jgi:hypothetical protein